MSFSETPLSSWQKKKSFISILFYFSHFEISFEVKFWKSKVIAAFVCDLYMNDHVGFSSSGFADDFLTDSMQNKR